MNNRRLINPYYAVLLITITGAIATLFIVHMAYATTFRVLLVNGQTGYAYYFQQ